MKFRKHISKLLALGILTNNIYFNSSANTEIPNRYQTLEGEYITIDDSTEGELVEIEVFGNTTQSASSKNLFSSKLEKGFINVAGDLMPSNASICSKSYIRVNPDTKYSIGIEGYNSNIYIHEYDKNYSLLKQQYISNNNTFSTDSQSMYIKINTLSSPEHSLDIDAKIQMNEGNTLLDYEPYSNLLDTSSIGDLYVDDEGNPILDSQGREQYKFDIIGSNQMFNYNQTAVDDSPTLGQIEINSLGNGWNVRSKVKNHYQVAKVELSGLIPHKEYRLKAKAKNHNGTAIDIYMNSGIVGEFKNETTGDLDINRTFMPQNESVNLFLYISKAADIGNADFYDFVLTPSEFDIDRLDNKVEILLPTQLQKVGDIADRLYWNSELGRYVVEKNIELRKPVRSRGYYFDYEYDIDNTTNNIYLWQLIWDDNTINSSRNGLNAIFYNPIMRLRSHGFTNTTSALIDTEKFNELGYSNTEEDVNRFLLENDSRVLIPGLNSELIETNITSKLKIPTYDGKTYVFTDIENGINPTLKVTVDRLPQVAKNAVIEAETNSSLTNISLARMYINMLPESLYKDQLQEQLSQVFSSDMTLDRNNATANLDVYIKSENMLSMSLNTNSVSFDNYSGVSSMEIKDAVGITISSSLPYSLNAYMPNEITSSDGLKTMPIDILNIKESSKDDYQIFADTINKVVLKEDCAKGNGINHLIDLKLDSNNAHKADIYKTVIKFEAEQK